MTNQQLNGFSQLKNKFFFIKLGISVVLISLIIFNFDLNMVFQYIKEANTLWVFLGCLVYIVSIITLALRWKIILNVQGVFIPYFRLLRIYFIAFFFNNFLPSTIGGDVMRVYLAGQDTSQYEKCTASVFTERLIGFTAIAIIATIGFFLVIGKLSLNVLILVLVPFLLISLCGSLVVFSRRGNKLMHYLVHFIPWEKFREKLNNVIGGFEIINHQWRLAVWVFTISLFYQFLIIIFSYFIAESINLNMHFFDLFASIPTVAILGMLPSINGLGIKESGFIYLFKQLGQRDGTPVAAENAIAYSALLMGTVILISLIGGILFFIETRSEEYKNFKRNKSKSSLDKV